MTEVQQWKAAFVHFGMQGALPGEVGNGGWALGGDCKW